MTFSVIFIHGHMLKPKTKKKQNNLENPLCIRVNGRK